MIPDKIKNTHQDVNNCPDTTTVTTQQNSPTSQQHSTQTSTQQHSTQTSTQHSLTEESNRNTETHNFLNDSVAAESPIDSSTLNREQLAVKANNLNLSGPVFTKLIMELYTYDQKTTLQGVLKRNIETGKTIEEKLKNYKHLTSSKIIQLGTHKICHSVCEHLCKEE